MNDNLDRMIDQAAREIMSIDGPADLRARVLSRLERPKSGVTWPRLVAAAALVVLITVLLMRAPSPTPSGTLADTSPSPSVDRAVGPPADMPAASGPQRPAPDAATRARKVEATVAVEMPETIAPLDEPDPIVVPAPQTRDIEPAEITIPPLRAIPDITVEPVPFPPGERD